VALETTSGLVAPKSDNLKCHRLKVEGNSGRAHCEQAGVMEPEKFAGQILEILLIFPCRLTKDLSVERARQNIGP
jgi:hypothetical protein